MKKTNIILPVVAIALILAGAGCINKIQEEKVPQNGTEKTGVDTSGWETYTNEEYGFSFKYPSDFELEDSYFKLYNNKTNQNIFIYISDKEKLPKTLEDVPSMLPFGSIAYAQAFTEMSRVIKNNCEVFSDAMCTYGNLGYVSPEGGPNSGAYVKYVLIDDNIIVHFMTYIYYSGEEQKKDLSAESFGKVDIVDSITKTLSKF